MTIIHVKRVVRYDDNGTQTVREYRVSDTPEFFCHAGLHAWQDEEKAEQCCKDGWTQGYVRGIPILVKIEV